MSSTCEKCGAAVDVGDVKCPACGAELPAPQPPPSPHTMAVLIAAMLPVVFLAVFLSLVAVIVIGGLKMIHRLNMNQPALVAPPVPVEPAPIAIPAPVASEPVVVTPPATIPAVPPVAPVVAKPAEPIAPPPALTDVQPPVAAPGSKVVIRGSGLAAVTRVQFVSSHGAASVEGKIVFATDRQVIVTVPEIPFANDNIFLLVTSPGGVAILVDQNMHDNPVNDDDALDKTAVYVHPGDAVGAGHNVVLIAEKSATISVGDHSIALLDHDVTIKDHGKDCQIYYVAPMRLGEGVSREGLVEVPSVKAAATADAFRVKPLTPAADR